MFVVSSITAVVLLKTLDQLWYGKKSNAGALWLVTKLLLRCHWLKKKYKIIAGAKVTLTQAQTVKNLHLISGVLIEVIFNVGIFLRKSVIVL